MDTSWSYWRGKYGIADALETYYSDIAASDRVLSYSLAQLRAAELAIDARMGQLVAEAERRELEQEK